MICHLLFYKKNIRADSKLCTPLRSKKKIKSGSGMQVGLEGPHALDVFFYAKARWAIRIIIKKSLNTVESI
jgi:hypothetical protein